MSSTLKILAGPAGAGHETWAQVWKREAPDKRRVISSVSGGGNGRGLGRAMQHLREGFDVCLLLTTEYDVEVLNFAGPDEKDEPVTALQEIEL